MEERMVVPFFTTAAAVSSQEVSMPRMIMALFFRHPPGDRSAETSAVAGRWILQLSLLDFLEKIYKKFSKCVPQVFHFTMFRSRRHFPEFFLKNLHPLNSILLIFSFDNFADDHCFFFHALKPFKGILG